MALSRIEPWDKELRADMRTARLMALIATITTKKSARKPTAADFRPRWEVRGQRQTIEEMKSALRLVAARGYGTMTPSRKKLA